MPSEGDGALKAFPIASPALPLFEIARMLVRKCGGNRGALRCLAHANVVVYGGDMGSLKRKTIWKEKKEDSEKNTLIVRIEETQTIESPEPSPKVQSCSVEIISPAEDDYGRPCKKRLKINVDAALVSEIKDAAQEISQSERNFQPRDKITGQLRYEGKSPLVVVWEVPPFAKTPPDMGHYVIGNGEDVRFILVNLSDVEAFHDLLKNALR